MWHTGLVAPRHVGSSRTRAQTRVPCAGRRIPNHCATREALILFFSLLTLYISCKWAPWIFFILEFSLKGQPLSATCCSLGSRKGEQAGRRKDQCLLDLSSGTGTFLPPLTFHWPKHVPWPNCCPQGKAVHSPRGL